LQFNPCVTVLDSCGNGQEIEPYSSQEMFVSYCKYVTYYYYYYYYYYYLVGITYIFKYKYYLF
jgi:hypothetical protein